MSKSTINELHDKLNDFKNALKVTQGTLLEKQDKIEKLKATCASYKEVLWDISCEMDGVNVEGGMTSTRLERVKHTISKALNSNEKA